MVSSNGVNDEYRRMGDAELQAEVQRLESVTASLKVACGEIGLRIRAHYVDALTQARLELTRRTTV